MELSALSAQEPTEVVDGVFLAQLAVGEEMSIQHIRMEPGAYIPEHSHHHEQLGFVYRGQCTFYVDDEEYVVEAGSSYAAAGGEPHAVENRTDEPMEGIDVFSPPRPNPDWRD